MSEDGAPEKAVRERLAALSSAAGVPVPALKVVPDPRRRLPLVSPDEQAGDERPTVEVTEHLLTASAAEQDWYLAACVGWWTSPVPRRRARESLGICVAALLPHTVFGLGQLTDQWTVPKAVAAAIGLLVGVVLPVSRAGVSRRLQRALDAAGHEVLRRAGRDPEVVARQAFGGRNDPAWHRRPFADEPTPGQRIAAARRDRVRPYLPLF